MEGFASFRHGQEYELELTTTEQTPESPAEVVIVNPVSKRYTYSSKDEFNLV